MDDSRYGPFRCVSFTIHVDVPDDAPEWCSSILWDVDTYGGQEWSIPRVSLFDRNYTPDTTVGQIKERYGIDDPDLPSWIPIPNFAPLQKAWESVR